MRPLFQKAGFTEVKFFTGNSTMCFVANNGELKSADARGNPISVTSLPISEPIPTLCLRSRARAGRFIGDLKKHLTRSGRKKASSNMSRVKIP